MNTTRINEYKQKVMVRADHYVNGDIIPIAYENSCGITTRIDRILSIEKKPNGIFYLCRIGDIQVKLLYDNISWYITGSLSIIK